MARRQRAAAQFTTLHLAALSVCVVVASFVVLLLGIYVGRGLRGSHIGNDERVAHIPVAEPPAMVPVERGPMAPGGLGVLDEPEPPAPQPEPQPASPATEQPAAEAPQKKPEPEPKPEQKPRPRKPVELNPPVPAEPSERAAVTRPKPAASPSDIIGATIERERSKPVSKPEDFPPPSPTGSGSAYTVQVLATRDQQEATSLAARLKQQQIGAYVSEVKDVGGNWYRVRIGIYDDLDSAHGMEARLRGLGLNQAYVSRFQ